MTTFTKADANRLEALHAKLLEVCREIAPVTFLDYIDPLSNESDDNVWEVVAYGLFPEDDGTLSAEGETLHDAVTQLLGKLGGRGMSVSG